MSSGIDPAGSRGSGSNCASIPIEHLQRACDKDLVSKVHNPAFEALRKFRIHFPRWTTSSRWYQTWAAIHVGADLQ